eukprot:6207521-Pleurochrysis_carterae.AAC.1
MENPTSEPTACAASSTAAQRRPPKLLSLIAPSWKSTHKWYGACEQIKGEASASPAVQSGWRAGKARLGAGRAERAREGLARRRRQRRCGARSSRVAAALLISKRAPRLLHEPFLENEL